MRRMGAATIAAVIAHVLAWTAFLFLALWPYTYRGVESGQSQSHVVAPGTFPRLPAMTPSPEPHTAYKSLITENGIGVLGIIVVPVLITGVGLAASLHVDAWPWENAWPWAKAALWATALLLLGLCILGALSIGTFYLPGAIALIVAATLAGRHNPRASAAP